MSNMKTITLDGQTFTTDDIIDKVGCARSTATKRIKNCKTMDELFFPVAGIRKIRKFIIEGKEFDVNDVVEKVNCSKSAAYGRLQRAITIKQLFYESSSKNSHNQKMTDINDPIIKLLYGKW